MQNARINQRQMEWLKLYLGRDARYSGNATACYKRVYQVSNERVAQTSGSRLLNHPAIKAEIEKAQARALKQAGINQQFVLEQSVRLYDMAVGDVPVEVWEEKDSEGRVHVRERREINLTVASKQLDQIGRHTQVQAFQDNVEHTHTHTLERRLAARSRMIEEKAQAMHQGNDVIEGHAVEVKDEKRVHLAGGQINDDRAEKTSSQRAGATEK